MIRQTAARFVLALVVLLLPVSAAAEVVLVQIPKLGPSTTPMAGLEGDGWFEVESFSMGVENSVEIGSLSTNRGESKAAFTPIELSRKFDGLSAQLAQRCAEGRHIEKMTILVIKGRRVPINEGTVAKIELKDVMVESLTLEGSDQLSEQVVLQAGAIQVQAHGPDAKGANMPAGNPFMWSQVQNKGVFETR